MNLFDKNSCNNSWVFYLTDSFKRYLNLEESAVSRQGIGRREIRISREGKTGIYLQIKNGMYNYILYCTICLFDKNL